MHLLIVVVVQSRSQNIFDIEMSGTVNAGYSSTIYSDYFFGERDLKARTISAIARPMFGLFIDEPWEITFSGDFSANWTESNSFIVATDISGRESITEYYYDVNSYFIGIATGIMWNKNLDSTMVFFVGPRVGVGWSGFFNSRTTRNTNWTKPETMLLAASIGMRFFVANSWAIVVQANYDEFERFRGAQGVSNSRVTLGLGISVFR
jgi:hypothetical protein